MMRLTALNGSVELLDERTVVAVSRIPTKNKTQVRCVTGKGEYQMSFTHDVQESPEEVETLLKRTVKFIN